MSLCTTRFVRKASRGWNQQRSGYVPIHPGKTCSYEYDFGSTTELLVKGIAEHEVDMKGKAIQILAGNSLPIIPTSEDAYISGRLHARRYMHSPSSSLCSEECWTVTFSTCTVSKTSSKAVPTILSIVSSVPSASSTSTSENLSEQLTRTCMIHIAFSPLIRSEIQLIPTNEFRRCL